MNRTKIIRLFKKLHRWPSVVIAFFAILYAFSGIVLNHREVFSSLNIPRKLMPPGYQYSKWNMAAIRGSVQADNDSVFVYGNTGIWLTTNQLSEFKDFNHGFPHGIDKRKIYSLQKFKNQLVAATHFGLFQFNSSKNLWEPVVLPTKDKRITDLAIKSDTLLVLTRSILIKTPDLQHFEVVKLPKPAGYERKTGMFNTLWELHSGELFGFAGRLFVDILGFTVIFLSITGLIHFIFPGWIRRRKMHNKPTELLIARKKINLHWHNVIGYIAVVFLVINTLAGMFLRPPLLIPVANLKVGILPFTHLDNDNPWFDKLRRVTWNDSLQVYLFSTSDGFYYAGEQLNEELQVTQYQPIVSIMGCNVLEAAGPTSYLVGSFNGLFLWNIAQGNIVDYMTGKMPEELNSTGRPIGNFMVAGLVNAGQKAWWFDYNKGAIAFDAENEFPDMTEEIRSKSPVSLWNAALEIHTGRIFEHLIGPFYILIVPLAGLCLIMVLISGFFVWWLAFSKRK